ncbi:hypothetical protein N7532_002092 [Penicillium argentinense]|uniref:Mediator of RNA polymerase II transcription subunit 31 n=1 Tax=Penicillium argentinense TaxID=1131581 RepID=A0A9W9KN37_9EURO|nr:uncharacterized protein N7532_002092 [Penicillium argentinense]KAJ5111557.1 hypothetical protein N7532_002092 [Penicillium argentinense]
MNSTTQPPPTLTNPRFTLELEFVSSLANPYYLSHLAVNYPNLLGISRADDDDESSSAPDAQAFAAYLAYLYSYWKTPEYSQFLTHPGPTLRALRLLQEDKFRREIILPQVIEGLAGFIAPSDPAEAAATEVDATSQEIEQQEKKMGRRHDRMRATPRPSKSRSHTTSNRGQSIERFTKASTSCTATSTVIDSAFPIDTTSTAGCVLHVRPRHWTDRPEGLSIEQQQERGWSQCQGPCSKPPALVGFVP